MSEVRVIEINQNVFAQNDEAADLVRGMLTEKGITFINLMSGPGSGKTTFLSAMINRLKKDLRIAEMDVDIASTMDAQRVADHTGVRSLQIHNGGLCHIDADMTMRAITEFGVDDIDLLILENIGNLVCPAEFDTGAHLNMMLLSVPEGDDKPLKYPLMFQVSDVVFITKMDTAPVFNFSFETVKERILALNPNAVVLPVSAKTGLGMDEAEAEIRRRIQNR
ncbi:MAG: hydrogenase nickel incorporation protein HypB [Oscillospiraceae bacterium]|nr:hydrogenase nickel incorporation protein HypB [Oscillospiraceae bacterium]